MEKGCDEGAAVEKFLRGETKKRGHACWADKGRRDGRCAE